jgi:hypothetical protein
MRRPGQGYRLIRNHQHRPRLALLFEQCMKAGFVTGEQAHDGSARLVEVRRCLLQPGQPALACQHVNDEGAHGCDLVGFLCLLDQSGQFGLRDGPQHGIMVRFGRIQPCARAGATTAIHHQSNQQENDDA